MAGPADRERGADRPDEELAHLGHPRGTLAIVLVYAVLFALGWIALWVFEFLPRGAPHP